MSSTKRKPQSYLDYKDIKAYNKKGVLDHVYKPFAIMLPVKMSVIQTSLDYVAEVFLFGRDPDKVPYKALALWNRWVRVANGIKEEDYPKVQYHQGEGMDTLVQGVELDMSDYEEIWNTARKVKHCCAGDKRYPVAFMIQDMKHSAFK